MTTPNHHQSFDAEPFSDEERELAARLGRIGPVDGPSPALDAKILAAAHAASVPRTRAKRRLAWLGVPPALVTGVGVAAAAVLVLGVVWQLRPQYGAVTARSEADAGEEIILIAPPADQPAPQVADAAAVPERTAAPVPARTPKPKPASPAARTASVSEPVAQAAPASAPPPPAPAAANEIGSLAPAAPEAFARTTTDAAADTRSLDDGVATAPPETRERHETYTTAARAAAERRQRSAAQKASTVAAEAAAASDEEGTTLDRVEVTGSRVSAKLDVDWADIPVNDDTHLASAEWLERIRARRDGGDSDNARASLKLFQREYPRIRLPDDLRTFAEAKQ